MIPGTSEAILADIDRALDQLIANTALLRFADECESFASEYAWLHKTQHSLIARVIHMEELFGLTPDASSADTTRLRKEIHNKLAVYRRLNNRLIQEIARRFQNRTHKKNTIKPRVGRHRKRNALVCSR